MTRKNRQILYLLTNLISFIFLLIFSLALLGESFFMYIGKAFHYIYSFLFLRSADYKTIIAILILIVSLFALCFWITYLIKKDKMTIIDIILPIDSVFMPFLLLVIYRGSQLNLFNRETLLIVLFVLFLVLYSLSSVLLIVSQLVNVYQEHQRESSSNISQKKRVKYLARLGILTSIVVVLQIISNFLPTIIGVELNLSLIAIIIGACTLGPLAGLWLGMVNGAIVLTAAGTMVFLSANALATIFLCLLKTGLAGLACGMVFKLFKNKNSIYAVIISSLIVPIVNTGLFIVGVIIFFLQIYGSVTTLLELVLTANFLIESVLVVVLSFATQRIITYYQKKHH